MNKQGCPHNQAEYTKDILIVVALILGFFILREALGWLFKTNHTFSAVKQNEQQLRNIVDILNRNGFQ